MKKTHFLAMLLAGLFYLSNAQDCEVTISGESLLCNSSNTTTLSATPGFENYYWNTFEAGNTIEVGRGTYEVFAETADGCLAYDKFTVSSPGIGYSIQGGVRVENGLILDAYYFVPTSRPTEFSFVWVLEGDTIGYDYFVEIDTVGAISETFDLQVKYERLCDGTTGEKSTEITGFDPSLAVNTIYVCANLPQPNVCGFPVKKPGIYGEKRISDFGQDISCYVRVEFVEDTCAIYDTVSWCFRPFWYENNLQYIHAAGSYVRQFNQSDTIGLLYIESIQSSSVPYSVDTLLFCEEGLYEVDSFYYFDAPRIYRRYFDIEGGCDSLALDIVLLVDSPVTTTFIDTAICANDTLMWQGEALEPGSSYEWSYPVDFGCDSSVVLTIGELPMPTISKAFSICEGDSIEVDGELYTEPGDFSYYKSAAVGCDSLINLSIDFYTLINVEAETIIPAYGSSSGAIFVNLSGGTPPYQLNWSNGSNLQNILGLDAGVYELEVTDDNGCRSIFTFEVPLVLSTESAQESSGIQIFPNPFSDYLEVHIHDKQPHPAYTLKLFNTIGESVWQSKAFSESVRLNLPGLQVGAYYYTITTDSGVIIRNGIMTKQ
jgi:hypothetical protein